MNTRTLIVTVSALAAAPTLLPSSAQAAPTCAKLARGAKVMVKSDTALVWKRGDTFAGCVVKSRRARMIARDDGLDRYVRQETIEVRGTFVGFVETSQGPAGCGCVDTVRTLDLASGRTIVDTAAWIAPVPRTKGRGFLRAVDAFVLGPGGAAAWSVSGQDLTGVLTPPPPDRLVAVAGPRKKARKLDHGDDIQAGSLVADGSRRVKWIRGGREKTAAFPG